MELTYTMQGDYRLPNLIPPESPKVGKRTIRQKISVTSVDTASEALALSLAEKAKVDMPYMMELTHKSEEEILSDLTGVIFLNPEHDGNEDVAHKYLPADEYLSGNVREKLRTAKAFAETDEGYTVNVQSLEAVQPVDLTASEISVRLGAAWLPTEVVRDFTFELLRTPYYQRRNIKVHYSTYTGEWNVDGKSLDRGNVRSENTFGTERINAYKIIEETLNLRDVRIFDYEYDDSGKKVAILAQGFGHCPVALIGVHHSGEDILLAAHNLHGGFVGIGIELFGIFIAAVVVEVGRVYIKQQLPIFHRIGFQTTGGDNTICNHLIEHGGIAVGRFLEVDIAVGLGDINILIGVAVFFSLVMLLNFRHIVEGGQVLVTGKGTVNSIVSCHRFFPFFRE